MLTLDDICADFVEILIAHFVFLVLRYGFVDATEELFYLRLLIDVHHFIYISNIIFISCIIIINNIHKK